MKIPILFLVLAFFGLSSNSVGQSADNSNSATGEVKAESAQNETSDKSKEERLEELLDEIKIYKKKMRAHDKEMRAPLKEKVKELEARIEEIDDNEVRHQLLEQKMILDQKINKIDRAFPEPFHQLSRQRKTLLAKRDQAGKDTPEFKAYVERINELKKEIPQAKDMEEKKALAKEKAEVEKEMRAFIKEARAVVNAERDEVIRRIREIENTPERNKLVLELREVIHRIMDIDDNEERRQLLKQISETKVKMKYIVRNEKRHEIARVKNAIEAEIKELKTALRKS